MPRQKSQARLDAMRQWLDLNGKISTKDLADAYSVTPDRIRKWKCEDKWQVALDDKLSRRKRGGQYGNKNAAGFGAPTRNQNAVKHGAYKTVHYDELDEEEQAYIASIDLDSQANMLRELQMLIAKESDLKRRIYELEHASPEELYVDKVVEMVTPKKTENPEFPEDAKMYDMELDEEDRKDPEMKISMQTIIKASPFDRAMKLHNMLDRTQGRIIKLIDSIKSYELESRRFTLEERKYRFAKQKALGQYEIDPETGEVDDTVDIEENL